ncbi:MAG TPA: YfhO family protein [Thermoanaerobaculia bacterium]|nr:YfhO family protein [Thermoanaerobaculia bacterium]
MGVSSVAVDLAFFVGGAALLVWLARWWQPALTLRAALAHAGLALAFWSPGLLTTGHQVATDIAYRTLPLSIEVGRRFPAANELLSDPLLAMLPYRHEVRESLLAGAAPLWTHAMGTGQPLLANGQSAPFAPLHLLLLALPPLRALQVAVALQTLVGLLLAHALLRRLGTGDAAAAFSAVAFALGSYAVAWAFYPLAMTALWIPGVLLGVVAVGAGDRRGFAGLVACATALALSGHPETLVLAALAAGAVSVAVLARAPSARRRPIVRDLALAPLLAFCLAAPALLPVIDGLPRSERAAAIEANPEAAAPPPFEPKLLGVLLDPLFLGSPLDGDWQGPSNYNEMSTAYAGASALVLALAGGLALGGGAPRARTVRWILAGGGLALVVALRVGPTHEALSALPVLGHLAYGRFRLLVALAIAVAAGLALDVLVRRPEASRLPRIAVAASCGIGALALVAMAPGNAHGWALAWRIVTVGGLVVLAGVVAWRRVPARAVPVVAVVALLLDLGLAGVRYNPAIPAELDLEPPPGSALAFLIERARESEQPFRVMGESPLVLPPNLASLYGLWDPRAYDPARPAAPARLADELLAGATARARGAEAIGAVAVRYRLTPRRRRLERPWVLAFPGPGGKVWRNDAALPLFYVPKAVQAMPAEGLPAGPLPLPSELVYVEPARAGEQAPAPGGRASVIETRRNGFLLEVESAGAGGHAVTVVASSVSFDPGWRVEIDGRPVEPLVIDGGFLGFVAPPGRHRVELRYAPGSWRLGLALAATGLAAALAAGWRTRGAGGARRESVAGAPGDGGCDALETSVEGG